MSVRVSMEFDGLCGFVPDKKAGSGDVVEQWVAVLPDLRHTFAPRPGIATAIAPHVACVIVPDEGVIDIRSNKLPSAIFRSRRFEDRVYRLYEFGTERLNLRYGRDHEHVRASVNL